MIAGLREEAAAPGAWPPADPTEGIETDIRTARALNARSKGLASAITRSLDGKGIPCMPIGGQAVPVHG